MKKILILIAFVFVALSESFAAVSVVAGVEDTLKRTRGESFRAFYNSVFSAKVFAGMDVLLRQFEGDLYLVSERYSPLKFLVLKLAKDHDLRPKEVLARAPFKHDSEFAYKYAVYKRILESSEDRFVLIGNDKGADQEVYAELKKEFPRKILQMYIHAAEGTKTLKGMIPYQTAFDVAVAERIRKRLSFDKVQKVGETITNEEKFHKVFPANSKCPKESEEMAAKELAEKNKELAGKNKELAGKNKELAGKEKRLVAAKDGAAKRREEKLEALASGIIKKTLDHCNG